MTHEPDITYNDHGGNLFSDQANESIRESKATMRAKVLAVLRESGPHTCDALETLLRMSHQTCSARCSELLAEGKIFRAGRSITRTGRSASLLAVSGEPS